MDKDHATGEGELTQCLHYSSKWDFPHLGPNSIQLSSNDAAAMWPQVKETNTPLPWGSHHCRMQCMPNWVQLRTGLGPTPQGCSFLWTKCACWEYWQLIIYFQDCAIKITVPRWPRSCYLYKLCKCAWSVILSNVPFLTYEFYRSLKSHIIKARILLLYFIIYHCPNYFRHICATIRTRKLLLK